MIKIFVLKKFFISGERFIETENKKYVLNIENLTICGDSEFKQVSR